MNEIDYTKIEQQGWKETTFKDELEWQGYQHLDNMYWGLQIFGKGNHRIIYDPVHDREYMRYDFNESEL